MAAVGHKLNVVKHEKQLTSEDSYAIGKSVNTSSRSDAACMQRIKMAEF